MKTHRALATNPNKPAQVSVRTRVLIVSGTLAGGGAERFVSTMLNHLDRGSFAPSLCLFREEISYPVPHDVKVISLVHRGPVTTLRSISRVKQAIDDLQPDIVLSNMDYTGLYVGEALRWSKTQPTWLARTSCSPNLLFRGLRGRCRKLWLDRVYPRADYFVANSHGLAESFQRTFPCSVGRTRVIGNPVDINRLHDLSELVSSSPAVCDEEPVIVCMARLDHQKRLDVLLAAFRLILSRLRANLWICGDGPLRSKLTRQIHADGMGSSVKLLGFCDNPFPILRQATLAISTSDFEGLPNAVLEAQALGVPTVATDCEFGPGEIIEHEATGLLTKTGDAKALSEAALELLDNPAKRSEMAAAAKKRVQDVYSVDVIMQQWESLLAKAVSASSSQDHGGTLVRVPRIPSPAERRTG